MMICKCCGKEARWCGEGENACTTGHDCDHIHCDHCGMHYSLESKEAIGAETVAEARALMLTTYNAEGNSAGACARPVSEANES